jgi:hypothetical protein
MLRSLRDRLIFTHILPILVIVPLTGVALFYVLETRFLLPRLAESSSRMPACWLRSAQQQRHVGRSTGFRAAAQPIQIDPSIRSCFSATTAAALLQRPWRPAPPGLFDRASRPFDAELGRSRS